MNGKVIIVDDEPHISRNLEKVIPWEMLGLEVVGTARNGAEAYELIQSLSPDLLLSDIRMPVMDGLELVKRIREEELDVDVIMLSGYQDFAYTRTAIQYGVKDYILKPIPYDELTGVIARVMSEQRNKRRQRKEEERKLGRMIDMAGEKMLYDILMDYTDPSSDHWLMNGEEQRHADRSYMLALFNYDVGSEAAKDWREWTDKERKLWNFAIYNVLRESMQQPGQSHAVIQMRDGEWCVLVERTGEGKQDAEFDREAVREWTLALLEQVKKHVKLTLETGIYPSYVSIKELSGAYKTVQRGMQLAGEEQQLSKSEQSVRFYEDDASEQSGADLAMWGIAERLVSGLKRGDKVVVEDELREISTQMKRIDEPSYRRLRPMIHFIALHMMREMKETGLLRREQEEQLWRKLDKLYGVKDLIAMIRLLSDAGLERDNRKQSERSMLEAKAYLDRNLFRDISVEETASHVGLSASYFSLLFKQTFGLTFIEYVTRQRMEKAKAMLAETTKSVAQIAKEVGYSERRYFTKVFMKFTGENPTDYRSSCQPAGVSSAPEEPEEPEAYHQ
ncbi:response regulator transcription factor [Paenibacillus kobensis]|uniref:response regulator transcription factor n=1 Tax=Paenibacillus kobensis TaxID=59841 RepID=UPI000FD8E4D6|nr:response regulator [Paenibacillus kobensis]